MLKKNSDAAGMFLVLILTFLSFSIVDFFFLERPVLKFIATVICMVFVYLLFREWRLMWPLVTMIISFCLAEFLVAKKVIDTVVEHRMPFNTKDLLLMLTEGIGPILVSGLTTLLVIVVLQKKSTRMLEVPSLVLKILSGAMILSMVVIASGLHAKLSGLTSLRSETVEEQVKELGWPESEIPHTIEKLAKISSLCAQHVYDKSALQNALGQYLKDEDETIRFATTTAFEARSNISSDIGAFRELISKPSPEGIPSVTVPIAISFFVTMKSALDEKFLDKSPTKNLSALEILAIIDPQAANMSLLLSTWDEKDITQSVRSEED